MADLDVTQELERFKRAFGVGYRKNLFIVNLLFFNPQSYRTYTNLITQNQSNKNKYGTAAETLDLLKFPFANISSAKDNAVGFRWFGLAKGVQLPGHTIKQGNDVMKYARYPNGADKGTLKISYYNDSWDVNYQFWRNYIRNITDGRTLKYPDEYMCDVEITIYNYELKAMKYYTFKRCYPIGIGDLDHSFDEKGALTTFDITLEWQDYTVDTTQVGRALSII